MAKKQKNVRFSYWMYYIKDASGRYFKSDIRPILKNYCALKNNGFKRQFVYDGNNLFIFSEQLNFFLFVVIRDNEIVKKVNTENIQVSDIEDMLANNEHLGYASYLYIKEDHLAYGCTMMAPRANAFADMMTQLFSSLGKGEYQFILEPALRETTVQEALSLPFVGRTHIQVNHENKFFQDIARSIGFGDSPSDSSNIDEIEVIIKPKRNKPITRVARKIIRTSLGSGLEKLVIRGRQEDRDRMLDYYVAGNGQISDDVSLTDSIKVSQTVESKMKSNKTFRDILKGWREDETWSDSRNCSISELHNNSIWPSRS